MDNTLAFMAAGLTWFCSQPTPEQVLVVVGMVAALYALLVIVRLIVAVLYGAFRGLG